MPVVVVLLGIFLRSFLVPFRCNISTTVAILRQLRWDLIQSQPGLVWEVAMHS